MAQATAVSPQASMKAAKEPFEAFNAKDWDRARTAITKDFLYDEIATGRRMNGADETLDCWKGWAQAFPDALGTYRAAHVAGEGTVVLELTWTGTHRGALETPNGPIAPTGKRIDVPACAVVELAGGKAKTQRHYFDMATMLRQIGVME